MLHLLLLPAVEETFRQPGKQIQALVGLSKQQRAPIATDRAAVELGNDFALPAGFKSEVGLDTLCHSEGRFFLALTVVWKLSYATKDGLLPN
jgi:hypothetical protein